MGILSKLNKLESEAAVTVGGPASGSVELPTSPGLRGEGKGRPRILDMEPASHCFQAEDSFYQMKSQAEHQHVKQWNHSDLIEVGGSEITAYKIFSEAFPQKLGAL